MTLSAFPIAIDTLGRLLIRRDGQTIDGFVSQKAPALFLYLLYHPYEHPRDVLAERFWSDTSNEQALKNLRTVLSNLQKFLGDYLDVTRQTLAILNPEHIWLDAQVFTQQIDAMLDKRQRLPAPRRQRLVLEDAMHLYQGEFLAGVKLGGAPELEAWVSAERERLHERARLARLRLLQLAMMRGQTQEALDHARQMIVLDPLHEETRRLVMQLLVAQDNRPSALRQYEQFVRLLHDELDVEPEPETTQLYQQIRTGRYQPSPVAKPVHNLLEPIRPYIEYAPVVETIHRYLDDPDCRLLTLLGAGGMGKTRLAQHIASQRLHEYADGVFFVSLAPVAEVAMVAPAILSALTIPYTDTRYTPEETLFNVLQQRHCLLILDNLEHLPTIAELVMKLLSRLPHIQILATSRHQLALQQEQLFPLMGLPYPESDNDPNISESEILFEQIALRVQPHFSMDEQHRYVAQLCRIVEGMPLALVIAGSWVQHINPAEILNRIQASLDFLTLNRHDLPERHRGITALLTATWQDLSTQEQTILGQLAVFTGDFSAQTAIDMLAISEHSLQALAGKSLLQPESPSRYSVHELLRRFILEQIAPETLAHAHHTYQAYFAGWIQTLLSEEKPQHEQFLMVDQEYHHLLAWDALPPQQQALIQWQSAHGLTDYWIARGHPLQPHVDQLEASLATSEESLDYGAGCIRLGQLLLRLNNPSKAEVWLETGLALAQSFGDIYLEALAQNEIERLMAIVGDFEGSRQVLMAIVALCEQGNIDHDGRLRRLLATVYSNLGTVHLQLHELETADSYTRLALELKQSERDMVGEGLCWNTLGIIALDRQYYPQAQDAFSQALKLAKATKHTRHQTIYAGNLAEALYKQGNYGQAEALYQETWELAQRIDNAKTLLNVLEQLTNVALMKGENKRAAQLWGAALQLRDQLSLAIEPRQRDEFAEIEARLGQVLGQHVSDLTQMGAAMDGQVLHHFVLEPIKKV